MKKIFFLMHIIILLGPLSSPLLGAKKALLVGIKDYENLPTRLSGRGTFLDLRGSINDVNIMRDILTAGYGFTSDDIYILTDEKASRRNIERVFNEWLVGESRPGDLVVFFFSGHGSHVPDQNGDEDDGLDEVLCPYDFTIFGGKNIILDDDLGMWLRRLVKRDVVVIIDSCHAGTVTRSIIKNNKREEVSNLEETSLTRKKLVPIIDYLPSHTRGKDLPSIGDEPEGQIFMAASRDYQIALEINSFGKYHGGFTYSLVDGLKKLQGATYLNLYDYVNKMVKDRLKLDQDPQIEPSSEKMLNWPVFSPRLNIIAQVTTTLMEPLLSTATSISVISESVSTITATFPAPQLPSEAEIREEKLLVTVESFKRCDQTIMREIIAYIDKIPYVRIVANGGEYFDRLIRGEMIENKILVRVLNRIGDVIKIGENNNIINMIHDLAPHLEYAYLEKQLAYITNPNPPFKVKVWVTDEKRRDFRIGEKIVFNFRSEKDCYLLMLNLDSKGNFHVIFPNQYNQENTFVPANTTVEIPNEQMRRDNFEFMFDLPAGEETVKVIATSEKLDLGSLDLQKFEGSFQTVAGASHSNNSPSRNLVKDMIIALQGGHYRWSEDSVVVRSHEAH